MAVRSGVFFSQHDNPHKTYLERVELVLPSFVLIFYENSSFQNKGVGQNKHAVENHSLRSLTAAPHLEKNCIFNTAQLVQGGEP